MVRQDDLDTQHWIQWRSWMIVDIDIRAVVLLAFVELRTSRCRLWMR